MKTDELEKRAKDLTEKMRVIIEMGGLEAIGVRSSCLTIVIEALQQVRREALEEAAQIAESGKNGDEYTDCVSDLIAEAFRAKAKEME